MLTFECQVDKASMYVFERNRNDRNDRASYQAGISTCMHHTGSSSPWVLLIAAINLSQSEALQISKS